MTSIAVIYVRCSTKEQETEGYSLDYQIEECKRYIEKKELAYLKTYTDPGISGTTPALERPGMRQLLEDAEKGKFGVIVFHAFDRLARNMKVAYNIISMLEDRDIIISECQHDIDTTTNDGKTRMAMYFTFAQMEHGTTKERSMMGRNIKKKKTGWVGGRVPFGYKKPDDDKDSLPVINPSEADTVRLIYDMYWKDGYPVSKIPALLESQSINTGSYNDDKGWNVSKVVRILKDHKNKYDGGLIGINETGNRWGKILDDEYPTYPRPKKVKKK